jgi:hypothetical protein
VIRAANAGDVAGVIAAGPTLSGFVFYNAARNAVQVKACGSNEIVASLRIDASQKVVARTLPSASQLLYARSEPAGPLVRSGLGRVGSFF